MHGPEFLSVNEVVYRSLQLDTHLSARLDRQDVHAAREALNDDVVGWMVPAGDQLTCDHEHVDLIPGIVYCIKCADAIAIERV